MAPAQISKCSAKLFPVHSAFSIDGVHFLPLPNSCLSRELFYCEIQSQKKPRAVVVVLLGALNH